MLQRMIGAARLNVHTYEDVENDQNATKQALLVVVLVSIASGGIAAISVGENFVLNFLAGIIVGIVGWAIWAFIVYIVGTKILNTPETHADWGQLARTTAFAQTPGLLRVFGFIPYLGVLIVFISMIWQMVAMVIAVRQALDYQSTLRAVCVVIISWLIPFLLVIVLFAIIL